MGIGNFGEGLIFLLSQPRGGSTLLQRILGGHPDILTLSEPWLMLHPFYALREEGWQAEYDARFARQALRSFLRELPGGDEDYFEGVRRMYGYLYRRALEGSGKKFFLDKTPRYYAIIPELFRAFPKARFLFLFRNPLAVLHSIFTTTWIKEHLIAFYWAQKDLIDAVFRLLEGRDLVGRQGYTVSFEDLVYNPEREVSRICDWLGIPFSPELVNYSRHPLPRWPFGDQKIYTRTRPDPKAADRWEEGLTDPQLWRLAKDYLELLGRETVERMGYDYQALEGVLKRHAPSPRRLMFTFSAHWLLSLPPERRPRWQRGWVWLVHTIRQRGFLGAVRKGWRKIRALPIAPLK